MTVEVAGRTVWSLGQVTSAIARRFADIPPVWIEGEVAEPRRAGGTVYLSLRGERLLGARVPAAVWERIYPRPEDGDLVHVHGRVQFYERRGEVAVWCDRLEHVGEGARAAQIARVRRLLARDGLLRAGRERPLPVLPRRIGLVTSAIGAARDDFLRNAGARFDRLDLLCVACRVQGDGAPASIVRALAMAAQGGVDVVVITRGGGSAEDLMTFNDEAVCRAVAACPVPIVSAVGHERDRTLCDEVADLRVSTPTAAAIAVVPDGERLVGRLDEATARMDTALMRARGDGMARLDRAARELGRGLGVVERQARTHLELSAAGLRPALERTAAEAATALGLRPPALRRAVQEIWRAEARHLDGVERLLETLSPARTVARGYAIVRDDAGRVISHAGDLRVGQSIDLSLPGGRLRAAVEGVEPEADGGQGRPRPRPSGT